MNNDLSFSEDAERCVLGGLLLDNSQFQNLNENLTAKDFFFTKHQILFVIIKKFMEKKMPCDVVTIIDALKIMQKYIQDSEKIDEEYIFTMVRDVPSAEHVSSYSDVVRERAIYRQLKPDLPEIGAFIREIIEEIELLGIAYN